jgi:hypothetical protein
VSSGSSTAAEATEPAVSSTRPRPRPGREHDRLVAARAAVEELERREQLRSELTAELRRQGRRWCRRKVTYERASADLADTCRRSAAALVPDQLSIPRMAELAKVKNRTTINYFVGDRAGSAPDPGLYDALVRELQEHGRRHSTAKISYERAAADLAATCRRAAAAQVLTITDIRKLAGVNSRSTIYRWLAAKPATTTPCPGD